MKLIWKIFARDVRQATRNVIAVIVAMGLVIVPALYAWYNIAASWDPYGNTKHSKLPWRTSTRDISPISCQSPSTLARPSPIPARQS